MDRSGQGHQGQLSLNRYVQSREKERDSSNAIVQRCQLLKMTTEQQQSNMTTTTSLQYLALISSQQQKPKLRENTHPRYGFQSSVITAEAGL